MGLLCRIAVQLVETPRHARKVVEQQVGHKELQYLPAPGLVKRHYSSLFPCPQTHEHQSRQLSQQT